jgi:hypothetical protein
LCAGGGNAMVLRAGLALQDMEFVQFHPTGIWPDAASQRLGRDVKIVRDRRDDGIDRTCKQRGREPDQADCRLDPEDVGRLDFEPPGEMSSFMSRRSAFARPEAGGNNARAMSSAWNAV